MSKDTGGQAFPSSTELYHGDGMTLWDYLIAHAPSMPNNWFAAWQNFQLEEGKPDNVYDVLGATVAWRIEYANKVLEKRAACFGKKD